MRSVVWASIMGALFTAFFTQMSLTQETYLDIDKQVSYVGAWYTAEASVEKELLAIKSEDVDSLMKFNQVSWLWVKKNMEYGFINEWANSGYFDLELKSTTTAEIDLGSIIWWDIVFESLSNEDFFDSFVLNFNKTTSSDILVEVVKIEKNGNKYVPCTFYNNIDDNCSYISKTVINSMDSTLNWKVVDWLQIYYLSWENWFNNKIKIQWFNISSYNYRISFSTIRWDNIAFSYHVENWGIYKKVANNFIEIDTVWNAIDSFARLKLEKKISNDIQPNTKYVLFSDWEIAK